MSPKSRHARPPRRFLLFSIVTAVVSALAFGAILTTTASLRAQNAALPLATSTSPAGSTAVLGTNLIVNPGFEGGLTGWKTNDATKELMAISTTSRTGANSVRLSGTVQRTVVLNDSVNTVSSTVAGEKYQMTGYVRSATGNLYGQVRVMEYKDGTIVTFWKNFVTSANTWVGVTFPVTPTRSGAQLDVNVLVWNLPVGATYSVDDLSLVRTADGSVQPSTTTTSSTSSVTTSSSTTTTPSTTTTTTTTPSTTTTTTSTPTSSTSTTSAPSGTCLAPTAPRPAVSVMGISLDTTDRDINQAISEEETRFGWLPIVRIFDVDVPPMNIWTYRTPMMPGKSVVTSFRGKPTEVVKGTYDAYYKNFFATAPTNVPIYWIYIHEPDLEIAAGAFTSAQYIAAWKHIAQIGATYCKKNMFPTLALMGWTVNPKSGMNWRNYYPGPDYVSVLSWDPYNNANGTPTSYVDPTIIYGDVVKVSKAEGKPWGIAETGSARTLDDPTGVGRADWLTKMGNYLRSNGASFVTYFQSTRKADFELRDAPSVAAWKAQVQTR